MEDCKLDAVKRGSCRKYHVLKTGSFVDLPLLNNSRAQHRTLPAGLSAPRCTEEHGVHESYHDIDTPVRVQTAWRCCQPFLGCGA
eukprot:4113230-Prymnesium_polylepis.1